MPDTISVMPKPHKTNTDSIRIDKDIAKKARIVAASRNKSLPDYLNSVLAPIINADIKKLKSVLDQLSGDDDKPDDKKK